jgi:hypothetical protein
MHKELSYDLVYLYIFSSCALGFIYGVYNWIHVRALSTNAQFNHDEPERKNIRPEHIAIMNETADKIQSVSKII